MPEILAAMVSATFDGAARADSTVAVKFLMIMAVGLSAWLNYEHGQLLGYPVAVRVQSLP